MIFLLASCAHKSAKDTEVTSPVCDDTSAIYKTCGDQVAVFTQAVEQAKAENKIILITFGADWCPWCQSLHKTFESEDFKKEWNKKKDKERSLADRITVLRIGVSHLVQNQRQRVPSGYAIFEQVARDTANDDKRINGIPYLVFYNPKKQEAVFRDSGNLEKKGKGVAHDPKKILRAVRESIKSW